MPALIETYDLTQYLQPAQRPGDARQDAVKWGPNLAIVKGQAVGIKSSDNNAYPMNVSATDGTQNFVGFSMYGFITDANSKVFYGPSAVASVRTGPWSTSPIWTSIIVDPRDVVTGPASVTAAVAEVDTITPTNPTTGDLYSVVLPSGIGAEFTVGATQTATATVTGLKNSWNDDPALTAVATASGTTTLVLTEVAPGRPMGLKATAVGTGTVALVVTTASVSAVQGEVDTFTPGTVTTGDINLLTVTLNDLTTIPVSFTIGATQTAAAASAGLKAAWLANSGLNNIGVPTIVANNLVITSTNLGSALSIVSSVTGTGTLTKSVTTAAAGRSLADIQLSLPGARLLHNGFWQIP